MWFIAKDLSSSMHSCRDNTRRKWKKKVESVHELIPFFAKLIFQVYTNDGRTSKRSEYDYAKECQNFQWKCQIASGNTRNVTVQNIYRTTFVYPIIDNNSKLSASSSSDSVSNWKRNFIFLISIASALQQFS